MLGAIAGDVIGSPYEAHPIKVTDFPLFRQDSRLTDDAVLTLATASVLVDGGNYREAYQEFFRLYPDAGFGGTFFEWARLERTEPYNSWGNGAAMRVSPVGFAAETLEEALEEAGRSASVSHDHPEGVRGAQATAAAVYLARTGADKEQLRHETESRFGYDLSEPVDSIREWYSFDISCQGTVPPAIRAVLDSSDWEDAVRLAVSLGGDSDTLACITGGIAEALYGGVPEPVAQEVRARMDGFQLDILDRFQLAYDL